MTSGSPTPTIGDLKRQLGVWDGVALLVGIVVGSGIFIAPAAVARVAPGLGSASLLWFLGGLIAAAGALSYAECGARLPKTGGFYVYYRAAFGEPVAFVGGWASLLITYPASLAGIALIFARYMVELLPSLEGAEPVVGGGALLLAGGLNLFGVRAGAWSQRALTAIKVLLLAGLCLAALLAGGPAETVAAAPPFAFSADLAALTGALVILLWTYDGWTDFTLVTGELRDPARNLSRTVVLGVSLLVLLYILVQAAVLALLGPAGAAGSERVFADAVAAGFGGGRLVALLVVISTFGSLNGIVLAASRIGFAMAHDGVFPRWFAYVHQRWQTPARSLGALVAASLVYLFIADFRSLLGFFAFNIWIFYGLTAIGLLQLRRRGVGEPLAWRAPGGPLPPLIVIGTGLFMTTSLMIDSPARSLIGLALLAAGFPIYYAWRWTRRGS